MLLDFFKPAVKWGGTQTFGIEERDNQAIVERTVDEGFISAYLLDSFCEEVYELLPVGESPGLPASTPAFAVGCFTPRKRGTSAS